VGGLYRYLGGTILTLFVTIVLREPWLSKQMLQRSHLFNERRDLWRDLHHNFNFAYSASWRSNGDCVDCGRADAWLSFVRMIAGRSGPSSECSSIDGCGHARRPRHPHSALSRIGSTLSGNPCRYSLNSGHSGRL
jgi:hypothetical protein